MLRYRHIPPALLCLWVASLGSVSPAIATGPSLGTPTFDGITIGGHTVTGVGTTPGTLAAGDALAAETAARSAADSVNTNATAAALAAAQNAQSAANAARNAGNLTGKVPSVVITGVAATVSSAQVNVQDYGAVDDNATDNTAAVQTAMAVAAASGKSLYFPVVASGTYRIQSTVDLSTVNTLFDAGVQLVNANGSAYASGPFLMRFAAAPAVYQFGRRASSSGRLTHFVPSLAPNNSTFRIDRDYEGSVLTGQTGYTNGGEDLFLYQDYGRSGVASGSSRMLALQVDVINASNGPNGGRSEINPISHGLIVEMAANCTLSNCSVANGTAKNAGLNLYDDFTISGNTSIDPADREGFLGYSFLVNKRAPGNTLDANHDGGHGIVVSTNPNADPYGYQTRTLPTYPLNDMLHLVGISGPVGATDLTSGATPGANIALQIGGAGGSVWQPWNKRSYFGIDLQIDDYSIVGIHCQNPLVAGAKCLQADGGAGTIQSADGLQLVPVTVASLPACNTATHGVMRSVSDATAPTYRGALTGGGSVEVPVYCDGSSWTAH